MRILVGCEMTYEFPQPTPVIATLNVHASRFSDLERPDYLITSPSVPLEGYRDSFGNWCNRMVAPAGSFTLKTDTIVAGPRQRRCAGVRRSGDCRRETALRLPTVSPRQPLLRNRSALVHRMGSIWTCNAWLGSGAGGLRFRSRSDYVRIRACTSDPDSLRRL